MFYPEILNRYKELLTDEHLLWMISQLEESDMSLTKKHRWLGFIQGTMISQSLLSVETERNLTRDIFKGA